jgi:hypothetical protein
MNRPLKPKDMAFQSEGLALGQVVKRHAKGEDISPRLCGGDVNAATLSKTRRKRGFGSPCSDQPRLKKHAQA